MKMKLWKRSQEQVNKEKWYNKERESLWKKIQKHGWVVLRLVVIVAALYFFGTKMLASSAYGYSEQTYTDIISQINLVLANTYVDENSTEPISGADMQQLHSVLDECLSKYNRKSQTVTLTCIIHKGAFGLFNAEVTAVFTPDYQLKEPPMRNFNSVEEYSKRYELVRALVLVVGFLAWLVVELLCHFLVKAFAAIARKLAARNNKKGNPLVNESIMTADSN